MPKILVNDINIYYEAYGKDETIVYLQSPFGGINPGAYYFAGKFSNDNRIILWDCPNFNQSDVAIKDCPSQWHLCCEHLKGLLDKIGETSVNLVGCSGGGEMGLLFTHLYPSMVKSLAMYRPTDTTSSIEKEIIKATYTDLAEIAKQGTLQYVLEWSKNPPKTKFSTCSTWLFKAYQKDKNKITELGVDNLYKILTQWGLWMSNPKFYRANLDNDELKKITVPVMIAPSPDKYHPEEIALDLKNTLPNSVYYPSNFREDKDIYNGKFEEHPFGGFIDFTENYQHFINYVKNI